MALELLKELPSGVSGNYWKVAQADISFDASICVVVVLLFKDKAARDAGKQPLVEFSYNLLSNDFPFPGDQSYNLREAIYSKLKTHEGEGGAVVFDGAIDV